MSTQTADLSQVLAQELVPRPPENVARWRQALAVAQQPALAFITALAAGGLIVILSDLIVLGKLQDAWAQLVLIGYVLLIAAVLILMGAAAVYFNTERTLKLVIAQPTAMQIRLARLVAVVGGLGAVYILLRAAGFGDTLDAAGNSVATAYGAMIEGSLGNAGQIGAALQSGDRAAIIAAFNPILESMVAATPYIFAGLAVAVGLRGGLFNVGVEGQLFIGAILATYVGYAFKGLPPVIHIPLALIAAMIGGAFWGLIPGLLKAKFGAHEVINTIMMNYIAFLLSAWLLIGPMTRPGASMPVSPVIEPSAEFPRFFEYPTRFHIGFFLALAAAIFVYWFLFKSVWGFEIRTVGANRFAARYAGMNITRNIVLTMCISGALAGLAGANELLGVNHVLTSSFSPGYGFDSIALALLGGSHPFGVVLSALLFGTLRSGGTRMQNIARIPVDIIGVVQALVIVFIAAPAIIRALYHIKTSRTQSMQLTRGWGK